MRLAGVRLREVCGHPVGFVSEIRYRRFLPLAKVLPVPQRPPAEIGMPVSLIDTPALVVDLDAFERNLKKMADHARQAGVAVRPHAKTHKAPMIAMKQIALGAIGQCCQKVGEAEALVAGGVRDILVSNQVVGDRKLARLAALPPASASSSGCWSRSTSA